MSSPSSPPAPGNSVDVLYEAIKTRITHQDALVSTYDTKANFNLSTGGLLTAGAVALQKVAASPQSWLVLSLAGAAIVTYVAVTFCSFLAYKPRGYHTFGVLSSVNEERLERPDNETKRYLIEELTKISEENDPIIKLKGEWTQRAVFLIFIEVAVLAVLVIAQLLMTTPDNAS